MYLRNVSLILRNLVEKPAYAAVCCCSVKQVAKTTSKNSVNKISHENLTSSCVVPSHLCSRTRSPGLSSHHEHLTRVTQFACCCYWLRELQVLQYTQQDSSFTPLTAKVFDCVVVDSLQ